MTTAHGQVETPVFMPVGTAATVKGLDQADILDTQAQIILANTYHLYLRPGADRVAELGGLHHFMGHNLPMLTDSGGFQVFSLGQQAEKSMVSISDQGVEFRSHIDGSKHFFSPATSIEIQRQLGADIIMAFDECTPDRANAAYARQALDRTHAWAVESKTYWEEHQRQSHQGHYQALFGIVQGALHEDLRRESATFMVETEFDGYAVGGETIGYNMDGTVQAISWIENILPPDKPRYAMGVGRDPQNLIDVVLAGIDMFDCVAPTRLARNGALYQGEIDFTGTQPKFRSEFAKGRLQIGTQPFAKDTQPIQPGCDCYTCLAGYSRAYLHHLFKAKELTYYRLASIHNVRFMIRLVTKLRSWIQS